jgi:predicted peroxiredoxin
LAAGALVAGAVNASPSEAQAQQPQGPKKKLHILMRSSWGTDEPTRASFVFSHGLALADAGHDVQIFLTHDATYLMRKATVEVVKPIGWPPLSETMTKVVAKQIPIFA